MTPDGETMTAAPSEDDALERRLRDRHPEYARWSDARNRADEAMLADARERHRRHHRNLQARLKGTGP